MKRRKELSINTEIILLMFEDRNKYMRENMIERKVLHFVLITLIAKN